MSPEPTDDPTAIRDYLWRNQRILLTDFEKRCLLAATKREKALHDPTIALKMRASLANEDQEVLAASLGGLHAIRQRIEQRFAKSLLDGSVVINRCPKCNGVVRTPLAKQCLVCGHDWH